MGFTIVWNRMYSSPFGDWPFIQSIWNSNRRRFARNFLVKKAGKNLTVVNSLLMAHALRYILLSCRRPWLASLHDLDGVTFTCLILQVCRFLYRCYGHAKVPRMGGYLYERLMGMFAGQTVIKEPTDEFDVFCNGDPNVTLGICGYGILDCECTMYVGIAIPKHLGWHVGDSMAVFLGFLAYAMLTMGILGQIYLMARVPRAGLCSSPDHCTCVMNIGKDLCAMTKRELQISECKCLNWQQKEKIVVCILIECCCPMSTHTSQKMYHGK